MFSSVNNNCATSEEKNRHEIESFIQYESTQFKPLAKQSFIQCCKTWIMFSTFLIIFVQTSCSIIMQMVNNKSLMTQVSSFIVEYLQKKINASTYNITKTP